MIPIRLDCTHAIPKNADSPKNRHTQLNMSTPEHHQHKRKRDHDNDEKEEKRGATSGGGKQHQQLFARAVTQGTKPASAAD